MTILAKESLGPQLRFWSLHVGLTAAPSFVVALIKFNTTPAILGMVAGVLTFIAGYTLLCSSTFYARLTGESVLGEAVKKGTRIRLYLSLASAPLLFGAFAEWPTVLFAPDFWAGFGALVVVGWTGNVLGLRPVDLGGASPGFLQTYLITVVEGLLISFTLVLLVFFVLLFLNRGANRMPGTRPEVRP